MASLRFSAALLILLTGAGSAPAAGRLQAELAVLARDAARYLKSHDQRAVGIGPFVGPALSSGGPGLGKMLAEELERLGFKVDGTAKLSLRGRYRVEEDRTTHLLRALVTAEIEREGKIEGSWSRAIRFTADARAGADLDGAGAMAVLCGTTADLPPDKSQRERHRRLREGIDKPAPSLTGTRIAAARTSPYAIEILVDDKPRKPTLKEGHAFVEIRRGETYKVRLVNDSEHEAAVTLSIDGLSLFAFGDTPGLSHVMVPARSATVLQGWYRNSKRVDAFLVTEYAKSAAAQKLASTAKVGTITATFATAWKKNTRPPADERYASGNRSDATGRGPSLRQDSVTVERHVGLVRAAVSVRYTKPE
jgi:hypothetical protein